MDDTTKQLVAATLTNAYFASGKSNDLLTEKNVVHVYQRILIELEASDESPSGDT